MNIYAEILEKLNNGEPVSICTSIRGQEGLMVEGLKKELAAVQPQKDENERRYAAVTVCQEDEDRTIEEPVLPQERLIVLGGGHIALPVVEFGAKVGFAVTVADDRPEFANELRFPWADRVICDTFENAIKKIRITPYDFVVIITRGHRHDADCLRQILPGTDPAYLGLIGSRRRVRGLFDMLEEEGFPREKMDKICTPIGLKIGAVTPAEIAVSILAELVAYKRLPEHGRDGTRLCNDSDIELPILEYLAQNQDPKAIVTVIETKGSTPREAGAKMSVDPYGKVTGSIGGGCSESAVTWDAVKLIGTGRYQVQEIDLTGDVAESDGMVCGGKMWVLIEDGTPV